MIGFPGYPPPSRIGIDASEKLSARFSVRVSVGGFLSGLATRRAVMDSCAMPHAPEADPRFNEFVLLQAQNAGLFLGQIPNPATGEKSVNLRAAKSVIDSLGMLRVKTAGNLTETEAKLLEMALKNLVPLYKTALDESE